MKSLFKKRNMLRILVDVFIFLLLSFSSAFLVTFSTDYKLDRVAYSLNNYNAHCYTDSDYQPSILKVVPDNQMAPYEFEKLFSATYYTDLNDGIREININNGLFNEFSIHLETQFTFSIEKDISKYGGYRLDYGLYHTYYSDDILGPRGYLEARYDSESFIFISDSLADKLVDFYGIIGDEPYAQLITNKDYCLLPLTINDTNHTFCINNIVYTSLRQAPRTKELYGDFALFCYNNKIKDDIYLRYEMDLKDNPFCIKSMLSTIDSAGFNYNNSLIEFDTFNYKQNQYERNIEVERSYRSVEKTDSTFFNLTPYIFSFIGIALLLIINHFYSTDNYHTNIVSLIIIATMFFLYGMLSNFVYIYPQFSIVPISVLVSYFVINGKEALYAFKNRLIKKPNNSFYTINI